LGVSRVVRIDGQLVDFSTAAAQASVIETSPGVYSVLWEGNSYEARVSGGHIAIGDSIFEFEIEDPRQWKRSQSAVGAHGPVTITAPMPGKVVRILVAEGDEVTAGQGIVVVEAMKMQNELKSPRDGRVTGIRVRENEGVVAGAVLALIE
jgi:biotin carboxyl carrier protein